MGEGWGSTWCYLTKIFLLILFRKCHEICHLWHDLRSIPASSFPAISSKGRQCGIKNRAAIALQCKLNGKLIAAFLLSLYSSWGYSPFPKGRTSPILCLIPRMTMTSLSAPNWFTQQGAFFVSTPGFFFEYVRKYLHLEYALTSWSFSRRDKVYTLPLNIDQTTITHFKIIINKKQKNFFISSVTMATKKTKNLHFLPMF